MILHRAVRYLIWTRWKNRVLSLLRKLRSPTGALGGIVAAAVLVAIAWADASARNS